MILKFIYIFVLMHKEAKFYTDIKFSGKVERKKRSPDKLFAKTLFLVTVIEMKKPPLFFCGRSITIFLKFPRRFRNQHKFLSFLGMYNQILLRQSFYVILYYCISTSLKLQSRICKKQLKSLKTYFILCVNLFIF